MQTVLPSRSTQLPSSLPRLLPPCSCRAVRGFASILAKFQHKDTASGWELSPALYSRTRGLSYPGPTAVCPKQSHWLEGNSSSVGGGTWFQGARAAHAFAFVSITQQRVSDKEITAFEQSRDGQNLLGPGRIGPCSSTSPKQPQRCPRQHVLGLDLAK